jgi:osmotically inducible protein OsmC
METIMASITRNATSVWTGTGKEGKGQITTQSGVLSDTTYGFTRRFGDEKGTNPEELIAAAHAGCFNMALAFQLTGANHPPERLETKADVTLTQEGAGWKISDVLLTLKAKVPGLSKDEFMKLAEGAKANCPVSKVLNANITLKAELL